MFKVHSAKCKVQSARCTDIKGRLTTVVDFICKTCVSPPVAVPNLLPEKIVSGTDEFESVGDFCYLGDALGQAGGCAEAVTARIRSAHKEFSVCSYHSLSTVALV